jgi:hypothetical protein
MNLIWLLAALLVLFCFFGFCVEGRGFTFGEIGTMLLVGVALFMMAISEQKNPNKK